MIIFNNFLQILVRKKGKDPELTISIHNQIYGNIHTKKLFY